MKSMLFTAAAASALLFAGCSGEANSALNKAQEAAKETAQDAAKMAEKTSAKMIKAVERELPAPAKGLRTESIGNNLYVIFGPGGNIGVSVGADGVFIIDDKFKKNADEILAQISGLTDQPLRYVVNTHYHGDHTGSNAEMAAAGAVLMAHENVRKRMGMTFENKTWGRTTNAVDEALWPTEVYSEGKIMVFNDHTTHMIYAPGHTDGDSLVHFEQANTIHMGDNYFNGLFPYIDVDGGGSVTGMIAAHDKALALSDENTKIIPGHGPMSSKADLQAARDLLADIHSRVKARVDAGESLELILKAKILEDYSKYSSFINEENMVRIVYRSYTGT
jgi:glyoxylase-like metal-dependent hydrolase (beta-lactamase superfamily II)